jgi:hypothetical protein
MREMEEIFQGSSVEFEEQNLLIKVRLELLRPIFEARVYERSGKGKCQYK